MVGSPLGLLFVSTHLKFSKRFYVTWERSKSSFFLEACTARGAAQTRTRGSLICFSESSLQLCQVLNIDISLLDKRELWKPNFRDIIKFQSNLILLSHCRACSVAIVVLELLLVEVVVFLREAVGLAEGLRELLELAQHEEGVALPDLGDGFPHLVLGWK